MSQDETYLRQTFELARNSVRHQNQPFGALIIDADKNLLASAENSELREDLTCHAEMNAVRIVARQKIPTEILAKSTLYASTEPCVMCTAAIIRSKIGRIVYGCSAERMSEIAKGGSLPIPCRDITSRCKRHIEVVGPMLETEAAKVHLDYWPQKQ